MLREMVRDFVRQEVEPQALEHDKMKSSILIYFVN